MKKIFGLSFVALIISCSSVNAGLTTTVYDNNNNNNNNNGLLFNEKEGKCHKELYHDCGKQIKKLEDAINIVSVTGIVSSSLDVASCIIDHAKSIAKACTSTSLSAEPVEEELMKQVGEESKCHKALYKECGDELADLKKAIKDVSPNGIVGASLELSGCITVNFVALVKGCSPILAEIEPQQQQQQQLNLRQGEEGKCHHQLYKDCGNELKKLDDAITAVSFTMLISSSLEVAQCFVEHSDSIVKACTPGREEKRTNVALTTTTTATLEIQDESPCHKVLYKYCAKELGDLKKAIEDDDTTHIVGSSLELAGCLTTNFVDLVKGCSQIPEDKVFISENYNEEDDKKNMIILISAASVSFIFTFILGFLCGKRRQRQQQQVQDAYVPLASGPLQLS